MADGLQDRAEWVRLADRLARPVLSALAARRLKATMPVEVGPATTPDERRRFTHLEALGRLLAGLAPWLELPADATPEGRLRVELADLASRALDPGTDPNSPDALNFTEGSQPLVDAAFLAHALLRAPHHLWDPLGRPTRANLVAALKRTRAIRPGANNWVLFAALVEALLYRVDEDWVAERVERALRSHEEWYKGDGAYGDGPAFHWDYYNSFVIYPMLLDVLDVLGGERKEWEAMRAPAVARARRYAAVLERLISPEGTFPPLGRSVAYRIGVFQLLGQMALRHELPEGASPAQVRCGMTAVQRRMMGAPGTFDADGWLAVGFAGHQRFLGEGYISTGSTYLCAAGLLPLGLPPADPFWQSAAADWTARRLWSGGEAPIDHAF
jgi:hypothetical protein